MPDPATTPQLDFSLIALHDQENPNPLRADGSNLEPGNHLRWIVSNELGFPERFNIWRNNEDISSQINQLTQEYKDNPAGKRNEICSRLKALKESENKESENKESEKTFVATLVYQDWNPVQWLINLAFGEQYHEKVSLLEWALNGGPGLMKQLLNDPAIQHELTLETSEKTGANMRIIDLIQLLALDPYIAAAVGLYWIDQSRKYDVHGYIVEADYGDRPWPKHSVAFKGGVYKSVPPKGMQFDSLKLVPLMGNLIYVSYEAYDNIPMLTMRADVENGNMWLSIHFPEPVEEVFFDFTLYEGTELKIVANGISSDFFDHIDYFVRKGAPFNSIGLHGKFDAAVPNASFGFTLNSLSWRRKTDPIGVIQSNCFVIDRSKPSAELTPPALTEAISKLSPRTILHPAQVKPTLSDIHIPFLKIPDQWGEIFYNNFIAFTPVKMLYGLVENGNPIPLNPSMPALMASTENPEPNLVLWMPFNDEFTNEVTGRNAISVGDPRIVTSNIVTSSTNRALASLMLDGNSALSFANEPRLKQLGDQFSLYFNLAIPISDEDGIYPIFYCGDDTQGFKVQLVREGRTACRIRVVINGNVYTCENQLPLRTEDLEWNRNSLRFWNRIGVMHYNNYLFISTPDLNNSNLLWVRPANHGPVRPHPGACGIGADFLPDLKVPETFSPISISELMLWDVLIDDSAAKAKIKSIHGQFPAMARPGIFYMTEKLEVTKASDIKEFFQPALNFLPRAFHISCFVKINRFNRAQTILDFGSERLRLGIAQVSGRLQFWYKGRSFSSNLALTKERWTKIDVIMADTICRFYIDGQLSANGMAPPPLLISAKKQAVLALGGNVEETMPVDGFIKDLQIEPFAELASKNLYGAFNYIHPYQEAGDYTYRGQHVDIFGRVSQWGSAVTTETNPVYQIHAPLSLKCALVPLRGAITSATYVPPQPEAPSIPLDSNYTLPTEEERIPAHWHIETAATPEWLELFLSFQEDEAALQPPEDRLIRHELVVTQSVQMYALGKKDASDPEDTEDTEDTEERPRLETRQLRQNFEIKKAQLKPGDPPTVEIELWDVPFAQINLQDLNDDHFFELQYDYKARLEWQWTGLQQVFNPDVTDFIAYGLPGAPNQWRGKITEIQPGPAAKQWIINTDVPAVGAADSLSRTRCTINRQAYTIEAHTESNPVQFTVKYHGYPVIAPEIGADFEVNIPDTHRSWTNYRRLKAWADPPASIKQLPVRLPAALPAPLTSAQPLVDIAHPTCGEIRALRRGNPEGFNKVDWMDEPKEKILPDKTIIPIGDNDPYHALWKVRITGLDRPAVQVHPEDFVPGALVVAREQWRGAEGIWEAWYVLWHEWDAATGTLTCYVPNKNEVQEGVSATTTGSAPPSAAPAAGPPSVYTDNGDHRLRYYPGQRFESLFSIHPPAGNAATLPWQFSVVGDSSVITPCEGALADPAFLVAVDRRKPLPPNKPEVEIGRANVHGQSEAKVNWVPTHGVMGYNLYRALDTAIYSRDLDQRRLKIGHYAHPSVAYVIGNYPDNHPFADDGVNSEGGDVHEFLRAVNHKNPKFFGENFAETLCRALGISIPNKKGIKTLQEIKEFTIDDLFGHAKNTPVWRALNPVWQYWADRFYPALSELELVLIAERKGNETAFTLVNDKPILQAAYTDQVSGTVSNRYFYRLRTVAHGGALGTAWGLVSEGDKVDLPALRPRTPVWTKVEAGDREVTLQWALNREANFLQYRLYRAEALALLEDLRWAEVELPPGLEIKTIPDPRILTGGNNDLSIPPGTGLPIGATVLGAFRAQEYNSYAPEPMAQSQAMNYLLNATDGLTLRAIAPNTEMVLVYRDAQGRVQPLMAWPGYPFVDKDMVGLKDYWYKVVAVNGRGVKSGDGEVRRVRVLEIEPPPAPEVLEWERREEREFDVLDLIIYCERENQIMIQGKSTIENYYTEILPWSKVRSPFNFQWKLNKRRKYSVKIWSRIEGGQASKEPYFLEFL